MRFAENLFIEFFALPRHEEIEEGEEAAVEGAQSAAEALPPATAGRRRGGIDEQEGELQVGEEGQAGFSRTLWQPGDLVKPGAQGGEFGESRR